ncbi:hypothetical protein AAHB63_17535 [Bacillus thuringiensis]
MPISKEPILYPLVSSTSNIPTSESFTFDWNWGLHQALSIGTGLMKFIPGLGVVAGPYGALLNYVYGGVIDELFPKKMLRARILSILLYFFKLLWLLQNK